MVETTPETAKRPGQPVQGDPSPVAGHGDAGQAANRTTQVRGSETDRPTAGRSMVGRTVVITGASAGIGAAAARQLRALGARLVILGRSPQRTAAVAAETGALPVVADFARLADVRRAAAEIIDACPRIDVLMNNAGGLFPAQTRTEDGNELTFQVNHLAPFLLTGLLLPRLSATPGSRVIVTSSVVNALGRLDAHDLDRAQRRYQQFGVYFDSKLANVVFARELARRAAPGWPTATAVHPGVVESSFGRDTWFVHTFYRPLRLVGARTPAGGARPLVALATRQDPEAVNGAYLHRYKVRDRFFTGRRARDTELGRALWEYSAARVGLPG
ncbi:SDR family NAD(P)-dependent oxidoreductase [Pseudofrankia asymbiotica]|nr:SDR family NAD(P)-dependent oxidoreductase [Pseudofrankia asymbiotica]